MRLKIIGSLILVALVIGATSLFAARAHRPVSTHTPDAISGEWEVSFFVNGTTTPATFKFKLEGDKVTGTAESAHTGLGTIRDGSWKDNKLSFALDFKSHESIAVTGALKDGKLSGAFTTEGFTSTWEAKRKATTTAKNAHAEGQTAGVFQRLHRRLYSFLHH